MRNGVCWGRCSEGSLRRAGTWWGCVSPKIHEAWGEHVIAIPGPKMWRIVTCCSYMSCHHGEVCRIHTWGCFLGWRHAHSFGTFWYLYLGVRGREMFRLNSTQSLGDSTTNNQLNAICITTNMDNWKNKCWNLSVKFQLFTIMYAWQYCWDVFGSWEFELGFPCYAALHR